MPKKKEVHHRSNHVMEKLVKYGGALVILAILIYPFFFYVQRGIAYLPSYPYLIASAITAAVLIYSYFLILTIRSIGKIVVIIMLFIATVLASIALFVIFTPIINYTVAQLVNTMVCDRFGEIQSLPKAITPALKEACVQISTKTFFGDFKSY